MKIEPFDNPFRPGAGHIPPYLAGRTKEQEEVKRLLGQKTITENIILTGLRGVGKTVLLESLKPIANQQGWLWAGNDLSESASVTENNMATRILADIALVTSSLIVKEIKQTEMGFMRTERVMHEPLSFDILQKFFNQQAGLVSDKLKATLEFVWSVMPQSAISGIVFAYDEAQNLTDHAAKDEFPLSLLLEVFQSLQRKKIPFMLLLTGLPTLAPKLVEARTYSERMFHVITLHQLDEKDSRDAIVIPTNRDNCPLKFSAPTVETIVQLSGGYPYFIQFICKEVYDVWIAKISNGEIPSVPTEAIIRKLDTDFFQGRWSKATDRQRELLMIIPLLGNCDDEFTVQEIAEASKKGGGKPFSPSHINQMLSSLSDAGLIYKNRHGKYSLAVPLLSQFIRRQIKEATLSS